MASGDAQRAWFPEMAETLKNWWDPSMTWKECSVFCEEMTRVRAKIREGKNIKPIKFYCTNCQEYHFLKMSPISIRSLLFTLKKIGIVTENEFKTFDRSWKKYRKESKLDSYGKITKKLDNKPVHCISEAPVL